MLYEQFIDISSFYTFVWFLSFFSSFFLGQITHSLSAKDFAFYKLQEEKEKKETAAQFLKEKKLLRKKKKQKNKRIIDDEETEFTFEIKRLTQVGLIFFIPSLQLFLFIFINSMRFVIDLL